MVEVLLDRLKTALADRYAIERELGAGGMATVYLARDLKHDRQVAVKVLKPELAAVIGGERFLQEIHVTAHLQQAHILPLYDSGEADTFLYYVMPFVEGESLRDRLDRETQLPVEDAVRIASEVAAALSYAHSHGVIHRDIKPENILLSGGAAVVADFGIARAVTVAGGGRLTETGLSLGTPQYMSPEQATADRELDGRSDIYSLGCVLYEMLAGEPPHSGPTTQSVIAKVLTDEPRSVRSGRSTVPAHVEAAVHKALAKLPADRFATAQQFAGALTRATGTGAVVPAEPGLVLRIPKPVAAAAAWVGRNQLTALLGVFSIIATGAALWGWLRQPQTRRPVIRYNMGFPEDQQVAGPLARLAISPDGSRIVYTGRSERAGQQLWVRARDQLNAAPLPGTEGAIAPCLSWDGERVGFFVGNALKVASLRGGPPITVTDSLVGSWGCSWGRDGFLYADGGGSVSLARVAASGGRPEWFTQLDTAQREIDHVFPDVLPNGRGVLFTVGYVGQGRARDIAVAEMATGRHRALVPGVYARYAASGHLVYVTADGTLMVAPFDQDRLALTGEPRALVAGVRLPRGAPDVAISMTGTLLYTVGGAVVGGELVWVTRQGLAQPVDSGWTDEFGFPSLSPDGRRLAVDIRRNDEWQVFVKQLDRGPLTKLTFAGNSIRPFWTPDGRNVAFVSDQGKGNDLYIKRADGSTQEMVLRDEEPAMYEGTVSRDGRWLVYRAIPGNNLRVMRLGPDSSAAEGVATQAGGTSPALSPDGRWLAYVSTESGTAEVYVRPFPNTGDAKWQVSADGGVEPVWAHSGRELFYKNGANQLVAAEVLAGSSFGLGVQRTLFSMQGWAEPVPFHQSYDVAPDDQRFLMVRLRGGGTGQVIVVENWFEELKRLRAEG